MGHKHSRDAILTGALETALDSGLSRLTFGRVARRLGINDRTLVYYFPTKPDLLSAVVRALGDQLQATLSDALDRKADDHRQLVRALWPLLARDDVDPVFGLFFEANGLAAAGIEPFPLLVSELTESWISWAEHHLVESLSERRADAEAAVAMIDGLLLLRAVAGPEPAQRAARRHGVT